MKITYFFLYGRIERISETDQFANEMFYGYNILKEKYPDTEIIQFHEKNTISVKMFKFIDRVINKITSLPVYMGHSLSYSNAKKIYNSDYLIMANDRIAVSIVPILILMKLINPNLNSTFFVMGLFNNKIKNRYRLFIRNLYLKLLFLCTKNIIFLGEGEFDQAKNLYKKNNKKFTLLPFMVDTKFWRSSEIDNKDKKDGILFVGNDGNRDFDKVISLAKHFKDIEFTLVTKHFKKVDIKLPNINLVRGSWGNQALSDTELKELYLNAKLVILPIKRTIQPSGQSVTLQSMSASTPVMITEFPGFWDKKNFKNNDNIIFVADNSIQSWIERIEESYFNDKKLEEIAKNAEKLMMSEYKIEHFVNKLEKILKI